MLEEEALCVVRTFSYEVDARLAEAVLDANGIESIIIGDNAGGWLTYLDAFHPIRIAVKESDVDAAVALLAAT